MGQQTQPLGERYRLKTARETYLWDTPTREGLGDMIGAIPTGMLAIPDSIFDPVKIADVTYRRVSLPAAISLGRPLEGWIQEGDLKQVLSKAEEHEQRLRERENLPPLCRLANGDHLDVWDDILRLCANNEGLAEDKQQPGPYFTRAAMYAKEGNNVLAMQDYLKGLSCIKNTYTSDNEMSYLLYEQYFRKMDEVANAVLTQPFSSVGMNKEKETAMRHFSLGYGEFWQAERESNTTKRIKCYREALRSFENAIVANGQVPVYWYYRGLTHWRLGDDKAMAAFSFLLASRMEANMNNHAVASELLSRFQGYDRMFLEQIRWGDPSGMIIKEFLR